MDYITYESPVFGPVKSRRLGISLGINLLPADGKWCSFDCIYCECGLNINNRAKLPLPTIKEVKDKLKEKLTKMKEEGIVPDVLTFAGNGEPTLHPDFAEIVNEVIEIRNQYCPDAKVSILSNSTQIHRPEVRKALLLFDNPIMKLDTIDPEYINKVDQPAPGYDVNRVIEGMKAMKGNLIIQTMFMKGNNLDNTTEKYVVPYLDALKEINPRQVMIYTIDRETPVKGLEKASHESLDNIAKRIESLGIPCTVSY